jgi:hypothetical protein
MLPEFKNDAILRELIETFDARVDWAQNKTHALGTMTLRVRVGEAEHIDLPTVRLLTATSKAGLERARAGQFADYLIGQGRETARSLWRQSALWESEAFMGWVRDDVEKIKISLAISS